MHGLMAAKAAAASVKEGGLSCLELVDQDLGDAGVGVLAQSVKDVDKTSKEALNERLTKVDIRKNNISDLGVENLTDMLATNQSITEISLSENNITDHGAALFASVLSINHSLMVSCGI
jgi:Ran GTPase-activating protein (RanGAP) involved in mRNA processing and transport